MFVVSLADKVLAKAVADLLGLHNNTVRFNGMDSCPLSSKKVTHLHIKMNRNRYHYRPESLAQTLREGCGNARG
jgi:hypothetical protein